MRAVAGLRNPGPEYELTRHNVGYEVVRALADSHGERFRRGPARMSCEVVEMQLGGQRVVLAAPLGYMNESGRPVRALLDYFDIHLADLLVVHDDIDLPFGRLRVRVGGGTGGHNGLRSVERALGDRGFARLKVGVGRPPGKLDPAAFVLRRFSKAEREEVDHMVEDASGVAEAWVTDHEAAIRLAGERRPG